MSLTKRHSSTPLPGNNLRCIPVLCPSFTETIKAAVKEVLDERDQAHSSSISCPFSQVGSAAATSFYAGLGITIIDGDEVDPLPDQVPDCGSFDMSDYANEGYATPNFLRHISQSLQTNGVKMGRGGFKVVDVRSQNRMYELQLQGKRYRGGLDGAVLPHGVAAASAGSQMRSGVEVKHSEAHKARYRDRMHHEPLQGCGTERDIEFTGTVHGQALVEALAAAVYAEYPEVLLLQSSFDHNVVLLLSGGTVTVWQPASFNAAMWKMSEFLKHCSPERAYKFEQHKEDLVPDIAEPIQHLRKKLKPTSLLLEQLDTLTAGADPATKYDMALEFFRAARISQQQQQQATADVETCEDQSVSAMWLNYFT